MDERSLHCEVEDLKGHEMPIPNFSNFTYIGEENIEVPFSSI